MKKSSLGRKSSIVAASRKTSDFVDRKTGIPILSRSSSANVISIPQSVARKRDLSGDRVSTSKVRDPVSDRMSEFSTPCRSDTHRTPRHLTMSSGRPSSISSKKGDTRPLTDKGWQALALDTVLRALNLDQEGYDVIQTHKTLKPMSLSMFVDVCNFFLKRLDTKIELTRVNYLTELPFLMKKLMYKGKVDKMMLQTVNTQHNWPPVIGILHFLAELVLAAEDFKANIFDSIYPESIEADGADIEELSLKYAVPLFLHFWSYVGKQEVFDINELIQKNKDLVNHVIQMSGFNNELLIQEAEMKKLYEEARKKNKEALETFHKVEVQNKTVNDKLKKICEKNVDHMKEIDDLKARYQQELKEIAELEDGIKNIETECGVVQGIVNQYAHTDQDSMTPDEYESYKTNKQNLLEDIKFEEKSIFDLEEILLEETIITSKLKKECEKLFREYNSKIYELMKDDVSLRSALCHTRPRLGVTPCNESTAKFLEKTLQSYKERVAALEQALKENSDDSSQQFKLSEEMKDKMTLLNKLKSIHMDIISDHEKMKFDLQKKLIEIAKENDKTNDEILTTEAFLKKNKQEYQEKEMELKKKEEKLNVLATINQKKLNCRYRAIKALSLKLESGIDSIKEEFVSFSKKLDEATQPQKKI